MNLHEYAKNQAFSSFSSRDMVNLKILSSDWSRAFWSISQEPDISQVFLAHFPKDFPGNSDCHAQFHMDF